MPAGSTLTNRGRDNLTGVLAAVSGSRYAAGANKFVGWGTGGTNITPAATVTDLVTPAAEARVSGTQTQQTTSVTNDTYQVVSTITSASTQTINEAGVFDASAGSVGFLIGQFAGIALNSGDSITFTIKLQFS